MFGFKSVAAQALDLRKKNNQLEQLLAKTVSDVEYIAMMSDIDLEIEEDNLEGEIDNGNEE